MLFRRIKQHVENENWFAVCVDFFIVVVGVYVGLEVSNINEQRQEQERAVTYLERIKSDLEVDVVNSGNKSEFWNQVRNYGEAAITHAETGELVEGSVGQTILAYYQASQVDTYQTVDTTYLELRNAGELRLIRNEGLLKLFAEYYIEANGLQANHLLQFIPEYREDIRGMTPWRLQKFIWANCHAIDASNQYLKDCDLPVDDNEGQAIISEFTSDSAIVQGLRFWMTNLSVAQSVLDSNKSSAVHLVKKVDETLATLR